MTARLVRNLIAVSAVTVTAAGTGAVARHDKAVNLSVDGRSTSVHVFARTVGELLDEEHVIVGEHDVVVPAADMPLTDGQTVVVRYGRRLTMSVDGTAQYYYTTATTVDAALAELGMRTDGAALSVSRSEPLGRAGLELAVSLPKNVTVAVDGRAVATTTTASTVSDLLQQALVTLGALDRVSPSLGSPVTDGLTVAVGRVEERRSSQARPIAFATLRRDDDSLPRGTTRASVSGVVGERTISYVETWVDATMTERVEVGSQVSRPPVDEVVSVGTKDRPAPTVPAPPPAAQTASPAPRPAPALPAPPPPPLRPAPPPPAPPPPAPPPAAPASSAGLNLANAAMWDRIAQCESTGSWHINTGNGYYGGLQFDSRTWLGAGGGDFAQRADLASREQQITVANRVYAQRGLSPWGCAYAAR